MVVRIHATNMGESNEGLGTILVVVSFTPGFGSVGRHVIVRRESAAAVVDAAKGHRAEPDHE